MRSAATVATVALSLLISTVTSAGASPAGLPRLNSGSLHYLGSFRLPGPKSDQKTFDYGGTALAYDPTRNGLFAVGHDWYQLTAEVSVPTLRRSHSLNRLRRARYLQPFTDATDGEIDQAGNSTNKIGGQLVENGRLYGSVFVYYDASDSQVVSHWVRPSTSLRHGHTKGLFQLGHQGAGFVSGFMATIPTPWQHALGGSAITGNCCIPIISRTSFGPAAFAFDPTTLGQSKKPAPDHALVYYPQQHPTLGAWDASWNPAKGIVFGGGTSIKGVVFPRGSRSVLFLGTQGIGKFCYGEGTSNQALNGKPTPDGTIYCYDPADSSKGTHAYPYVPEVWAYDANDLKQVRHGHKRPWQVRPYATWRLHLPFASPNIGGAAYDPARGLIYVSQQYVDGAAPVIDVFRVP